jgi:hypothetical protein
MMRSIGVFACVVLAAGTAHAEPAPAVTGPKITASSGKSARLGALQITFAPPNHKHATDGTTVGMWTFRIVKDRSKRVETIELRSAKGSFQAEQVAFGVGLVFEHVDADTFTIVRIANTKPLDDDACAEKVGAAAAKKGLRSGSATGFANHHGIVAVGSGNWRGYCGTLTKRIWFEDSAKAP